MSLYLHIPFCQQACHYCNFHFSTSRRLEKPLIDAMSQELVLRQHYIPKQLETIYFGGGTPSLLQLDSLKKLMDTIRKVFTVPPATRISLEANPEGITLAKLHHFQQLGVNRLSMGIQSFQDSVLRYVNRAHTREKAIESLQLIQQAGFESYSVDLIYGIPASSQALWENDIDTMLQFRPPHISAYALTIEPHTVFGHRYQQGKLTPVSDEKMQQQFHTLVERLTAAGYVHYEISNFAQPGHYAQHNMNYWKRGAYLGIGPGAHSYDGVSRQWNVSHNVRYIRALRAGHIPCQKEKLTLKQHISEYIMTSLRTQWGCDLAFLQKEYGYALQERAKEAIAAHIQKGLLKQMGTALTLTHRGKLVADHIILDLVPS